jgi:guanylate kinase
MVYDYWSVGSIESGLEGLRLPGPRCVQPGFLSVLARGDSLWYNLPMEETKPKLNDIEAFRRVLADYQMSDHAKEVLADTRMVVLTGLAGGGRNTIIDRLVTGGGWYQIISDTTRPPKVRDGKLEQHGVNYYFRKEEELLRDLQNGEFLEAEIIHNQQVSGISIRELERANESGLICINEVEFGGANNIAAAKPDAFVLGLLPPSYEEWIRRFRSREEISDQEFINRMHTAEKVLSNILDRRYLVVINDDIAECASDVRLIVESDAYPPQKAETGWAVAEAMLSKVREALALAA